ncbi:MAG: BufA2 family periplasmic bufferin-type metallophore, partial [Burkholderiales bacterium]
PKPGIGLGHWFFDFPPFVTTSKKESAHMSTARKLTGIAMAAAAAGMFLAAGIGTASAAEEAKIKCEGVNSCKGSSACKTAEHACKGQNACAGHGFLKLTQAECDAAKAKLTK